jgi:hypothetical protein
MSFTFKFDLNNFTRKLDLYEQSQANFAGKVALTKLAKRLKGSQGLRDRYERIFDRPVAFTKNSTFTVQRGLELDVGIKDERALKGKNSGKGNPASKYLFPPIGVGSGKAYDTRFTQYLRNRDLINKGDYPVGIRENPLVRVNRFGNITANTYQNTQIALGKTRDEKGDSAFKGGNSKIQDQRVFAFKNDKTYKGSKKGKTKAKHYPKGIYRVTQNKGRGKSFLKPLFLYVDIPTQKKGGAGESNMKGRLFPEIVKNYADAQLFKIWLREIKELAK